MPPMKYALESSRTAPVALAISAAAEYFSVIISCISLFLSYEFPQGRSGEKSSSLPTDGSPIRRSIFITIARSNHFPFSSLEQ